MIDSKPTTDVDVLVVGTGPGSVATGMASGRPRRHATRNHPGRATAPVNQGQGEQAR
jgi:hypothetical protein